MNGRRRQTRLTPGVVVFAGKAPAPKATRAMVVALGVAIAVVAALGVVTLLQREHWQAELEARQASQDGAVACVRQERAEVGKLWDAARERLELDRRDRDVAFERLDTVYALLSIVYDRHGEDKPTLLDIWPDRPRIDRRLPPAPGPR